MGGRFGTMVMSGMRQMSEKAALGEQVIKDRAL